MTEHKHASILRAIADGKKVEYQNAYGDWIPVLTTLEHVKEWRIKPETIMVNGIKCPKPSSGAYSIRVHVDWRSSYVLCYDNQSDAEKVFEAMIKPFKDLE